MTLDAFFTLHRDLDREGPGTADDVLWALDVAGTGKAARICDAACGPGADLVTLRAARPDATLTGIDGQRHFIDAARARVGDGVTLIQGDIATPGGPYDLIWCAGALYFLGVTRGLQLWRDTLAPGGRVAFSEPCFVTDPPSDAARAFWAGEDYVTGIAGIRERIGAANYRILGERMVIGAGWSAYYEPMAQRISSLRMAGVSDEVEAALKDGEAEIARWRAAPDEIAYALFVVAPDA